MKTVAKNLPHAVSGALVGVSAERLGAAGHWVWAVVLVAAYIVALWVFYLWAISAGHYYAAQIRKQRRAEKSAAPLRVGGHK